LTILLLTLPVSTRPLSLGLGSLPVQNPDWLRLMLMGWIFVTVRTSRLISQNMVKMVRKLRNIFINGVLLMN